MNNFNSNPTCYIPISNIITPIDQFSITNWLKSNQISHLRPYLQHVSSISELFSLDEQALLALKIPKRSISALLNCLASYKNQLKVTTSPEYFLLQQNNLFPSSQKPFTNEPPVNFYKPDPQTNHQTTENQSNPPPPMPTPKPVQAAAPQQNQQQQQVPKTHDIKNLSNFYSFGLKNYLNPNFNTTSTIYHQMHHFTNKPPPNHVQNHHKCNNWPQASPATATAEIKNSQSAFSSQSNPKNLMIDSLSDTVKELYLGSSLSDDHQHIEQREKNNEYSAAVKNQHNQIRKKSSPKKIIESQDNILATSKIKKVIFCLLMLYEIVKK